MVGSAGQMGSGRRPAVVWLDGFWHGVFLPNTLSHYNSEEKQRLWQTNEEISAV